MEKADGARSQAESAPWGQRLSTAVVLFHEAIGELLGVSAADHRALTLISARAPLTGSELARLTGLTPGAITGMVDRLEAGGHVRRSPDPADRRRTLITPSGTGNAAAQEAFRELGAAMATMMARYDDDQLATIADYVGNTIDILAEQTHRIAEMPR